MRVSYAYKRYRYPCSERRELTIRALTAFAIERAAFFRTVSLPAAGQTLKFLSRGLVSQVLAPDAEN